MGGRWEVDGWDVDAASAVSVITAGAPLYKALRTKAKTFRHEGFPGDSSA